MTNKTKEWDEGWTPAQKAAYEKHLAERDEIEELPLEPEEWLRREREPMPYDEDLENADNLVNVNAVEEHAAAYATQAHAYATISIAKTLRRIELALKSR